MEVEAAGDASLLITYCKPSSCQDRSESWLDQLRQLWPFSYLPFSRRSFGAWEARGPKIS